MPNYQPVTNQQYLPGTGSQAGQGDPFAPVSTQSQSTPMNFGFGSYTATGATLGSVIPGLGTGVGAGLGADDQHAVRARGELADLVLAQAGGVADGVDHLHLVVPVANPPGDLVEGAV